MSDFFGDDFTAELKSYFLNSLLVEVDKFITLADDSILSRVVPEISEQIDSWIVDAKTNEFEHLSSWLSDFKEAITQYQKSTELSQSLEKLKGYADVLLVEKKDDVELSRRFSLTSEGGLAAQYLHCRMGKQEFVIPVVHVMEVIGNLPVFDIPDTKPGILGVIPFRGSAIPVFNLNDYGFQKLGDQQCFFVICDLEGDNFAVQVTETDQLITLESGQLQDVSGATSMMAVPFIKKFFIRDDKSVMVLDLEKMVA